MRQRTVPSVLSLPRPLVDSGLRAFTYRDLLEMEQDRHHRRGRAHRTARRTDLPDDHQTTPRLGGLRPDPEIQLCITFDGRATIAGTAPVAAVRRPGRHRAPAARRHAVAGGELPGSSAAATRPAAGGGIRQHVAQGHRDKAAAVRAGRHSRTVDRQPGAAPARGLHRSRGQRLPVPRIPRAHRHPGVARIFGHRPAVAAGHPATRCSTATRGAADASIELYYRGAADRAGVATR